MADKCFFHFPLEARARCARADWSTADNDIASGIPQEYLLAWKKETREKVYMVPVSRRFTWFVHKLVWSRSHGTGPWIHPYIEYVQNKMAEKTHRKCQRDLGPEGCHSVTDVWITCRFYEEENSATCCKTSKRCVCEQEERFQTTTRTLSEAFGFQVRVYWRMHWSIRRRY